MMVSGASVSASFLTATVTPAVTSAKASAPKVHGSNVSAVGCTQITTPMKPATVAAVRRRRMTSPRKTAASTTRNRLRVKPRVTASVSSMWLTVRKKRLKPSVPIMARVKWDSGRRVLTARKRPAASAGTSSTSASTLRSSSSSHTDMNWPMALSVAAMAERNSDASRIHSAPRTLGGSAAHRDCRDSGMRFTRRLVGTGAPRAGSSWVRGRTGWRHCSSGLVVATAGGTMAAVPRSGRLGPLAPSPFTTPQQPQIGGTVRASQNELLTRSGPDTALGRLMRRYWQPAALSRELDGERPVRPVNLLGERLVLLRDEGGRLGLIDRHCAHRGADLAYGRLEDGGLRCPFHGWLFDCTGQCLEQPAEPPKS